MYDLLFLDDPKSATEFRTSCDPEVVARREAFVRAQLKAVEEQLEESVARRLAAKIAVQPNAFFFGTGRRDLGWSHSELVRQRDELLRILGPPSHEETTRYLVQKLAKFPPVALEAAWAELSAMLGLSLPAQAKRSGMRLLQARVSSQTMQRITEAASAAGISVTRECHRRLVLSGVLNSTGLVDGVDRPGWAEQKRTCSISWREPPAVARHLRMRARSTGVPVSSLIRYALEQFGGE